MQALSSVSGEASAANVSGERFDRAVPRSLTTSDSNLSRDEKERLTLLSALCAPSAATQLLSDFTPRMWRRQLQWLDISGLALYLFGSLLEHETESLLPRSILQRWQQNLSDNMVRMEGLAAEADAIHVAFQRKRIRYAVLKGISLHPISVPQLELRSQLDLDFLVAEVDVLAAKDVLEARGFTLRTVSGRSWEFKANESASTTLKDLYKPLPSRSVELHVEYTASPEPLLSRVCWQGFRSVEFPVLHPADLFLGQGLHLFKHVCSEFFRVAHLLEFRRHVVARFADEVFWGEVRRVGEDNSRAVHGLGVVIALITHVSGEFAPPALKAWTSDTLSESAKLWVQRFGMQVTLGSFPGSKLYLLLQQELTEQKVPYRRTVRASLIPRGLPPLIARPHEGETLIQQARRNQRQLSFVLFRLRFHLREGFRYSVESWKWKRAQRNRFGPLLLLLATCLCVSLHLHGQQGSSSSPFGSLSDVQAPDPRSTTTSTRSLSPDATASNSANGTSATVAQPIVPVALSAAQITNILQENPDALVEVKQLMSDAAAQQGQPVSADNITDQMVYTTIATRPDVRANITVFLRSRGYVTNADMVPDLSRDDMSMQQNNANGLLGSTGVSDRTQPQFPMQGAQSQNRNDRMLPPPEVSREPRVLHRPAPYNLLSLHDLYAQVTDGQGPLKRFGADVFLRRDIETVRAMSASTSLDVPAAASYVIGPGDELTIQMWGGISQSLTRTVDREGFITLPEAGQVQIVGLTLARAQSAMTGALKQQYRNMQVAITLARMRSVRIYVVGDVQRPGAYEISSLATPISALYAAGGPTSVGSLRMMRHYRGTLLIGEIDLYDFLLHGLQSEDRLQAGDTLLIPPAGPTVAVSGAVKRPAIYELKGKTNLASLLDDAGTVTVTAGLAHITIDRIRANQQRETVDLSLPASSSPQQEQDAIAGFTVQDGDHIRVSPIEPYSQRVVYAEGHVLRPGRMAYHDGMKLSDVLTNYRDLLPEPSDRGEIVRLTAPDLHVETLEFNIPDLMIGNSNITLQPFDTVRVFGRYETDAPKVTIDGEVLRPGPYALSQGMTASQLVRMAGGFTRGALLTTADLTSYRIVDGSKIEGDRTSVRIGDAVVRNETGADVPLKAGDTLTVHKLTGWDDIGASIVLEGEVAHPGRYGFQQGEHLSSIIRRAGGFRDTSYPDGAVLIRTDVQKLEEKSREELIRQIETSSAAARTAPSISAGDSAAQLQVVQAQQDQILTHLRNQPAVGRLVIHISTDIASWENTAADIEVRSGDTLRVPKRPGFVLVNGQVYNGSAITFSPGKSAEWYLRRAGGATEVANTKEIFVIRANGSVVGRNSGSAFHSVLSTKLEPGDVVVVPQKIMGASLFWRNLLTVAQIASSIAITAAVAGIL
jgi:protein involved in polysaccharide export with SLBB domain